VSAKNLVLIVGAVAIFAAGLYLFVQVRATPAQAGPTTEHVAARPSKPDHATETPPEVKLSRPIPPPTQTAVTPTQTPTAPSVPDSPPDDQKVNLRADNMMELANKAYDRQDFDEAIAIAGKVLKSDPSNTRMLRIMVSSQCIQGDSAIAQQYYEKLPKFDRDQMKQRCDRYGVTFKEPAQ
jgi:tetratricopeptide (TPR) repeat protein